MIAVARAALPVAAIAVTAVFVAAVLGTAGDTLGYDYRAYVGAADRLLAGEPLYDPEVDVAGGFAIFLYPPPVALAFIPFALLPDTIGLVVWEIGLVGAFLAGVALLPVRTSVRWAILLLGGLDWPVLFALKLGQVGPLLFLLFVIGWRWIDRPVPLGLSIAGGAVLKVQPIMLAAWAVLTGRWRAAAVTAAVLLITGLVSVVVIGTGAWVDYLALLDRVSDPVTTPHNFTPGAVAYQAGLSAGAAQLVQLAAMAGTIAVVLVSVRIAPAEVSYLTTVVASQLLSPLLWDHYAMLLLLPVAWLLDRGQWWAALIPLATALPMVGFVPSVIYPVVFAAALLGPLGVVVFRRPRSPQPQPALIA